MKTKLFARVLCIVLSVTIIGSVLMIAIPMLTANAAEVQPVKGGSGVITYDYVNLRSGAGTGYTSIAVLRKNSKVIFEESTLYGGQWYKVQEQTGFKSGYVMKMYVEAVEDNPIVISAKSASTYVGCRYAFWQKGTENPVWKSSNTSVAEIDQNGVLTAKAAGNTVITVGNGVQSASCSFTVMNGSSTGISQKDLTLQKGKTATLTANSGVSWYSSNPGVASVSGGKVSAKAVGYATISAYNSSGASTCLVKVTDEAQPVVVPEIRLSASYASTYTGCQYALTQTGADAPTWSSSNSSVAVVDQNGVITAKSAGSATITASQDGGSASCQLTVTKGTATNISEASMPLIVGSTALLTANSGVKWYSSNSNIAAVSGGRVTAKAPGFATISAYTSSGASTCLIQVTAEPQTSSINLGSRYVSTYTGCQYAFTQTGASKPVWKCSDPSVAVIDQNGILTAKGEGVATVTVSESGKLSSCRLTVNKGTATGISKTTLTLEKGSTATLTANSGVNWYSSNSSVASVSSGRVTGNSLGYATISAYNSSGASTCLVQVIEPLPETIKLSSANTYTYVGCQYAYYQTGASAPSWTSSNTAVATIDKNGVVTAKSAGVTTITATEGSKKGTGVLTVRSGVSTGISQTSLTLQKGASVTLSAAAGVGWYSSNSSVATVSGGRVTAKEEGYATISAYTSTGASTCLVHVTSEQEAPPVTARRGYVTSDDVNMRSGPGTSYSVVSVLAKDTVFTFISESLYNGSWYNIRLDDGRTGYIYSNYAAKITPPDIKLNTSYVSTYTGCQYAFTQTGAQTPEWTSSNSSVAVIDTNGVLTAKAAGKTVITVSENGGYATCQVTVSNGTNTGISKSTLTLKRGETATLTAKTSGVNWYSSNSNVATVSEGKVTARQSGYTTISAYTSSGASTCLVCVTEAQTSGVIEFITNYATTYVGCKYAVGLKSPVTASWTSSNTSVATVDSNGVITAKSTGTAVITASNAMSSAKLTINVKSGSAPGISPASVTVPSGKSLLLESNTSVSWYSSNTNLATVKNGIVDTKGTGYVTISAYTSYGASTCLIHVAPADNIRFVYASPNSAAKNSNVTFKAITDTTRTGVRFVVSNGSTSYTVDATSKVTDGGTYIWSGSRTLGIAGKWTIKAYSKTSVTDYATTSGNGEGEVFVSESSDLTTTVLGDRRASDKVISLIAMFEGFLPEVTADYITGDLTIGYGKLVEKNEQFYNHLTKNEAYAYLCQTVNTGPYSEETNTFLTSNNIKFNQQQFDALVCFAYNIGAYAIPGDSDLKNPLLDTYSGSSGSITAGSSGYINTSGVNLRAGAGTNYNIVTTMSNGTTFTFTDGKLYNSNWYHIRLSNGTTGYVYSSYASHNGTVRDLNNINKSLFVQRVLQYHHASSRCYISLLWRRVDEMEMFFYGDYECDGENNKYGFYFRCKNDSSFGIG